MKRFAFLLLGATLGLLTGCSDPSAEGMEKAAQAAQQEIDSTPQRTYSPPSILVKLSNPAINESSGIAPSRLKEGWYYTHNDSGDTARFWRFDAKGKTEGPYTLAGVTAIDWEDMASTRIEGKNYLYFADIGDNDAKRASIQIYRVEEPKDASGEIKVIDKWDLQYPDGAHNAEGFMINPSDGAFYIVTKTKTGDWQVFWKSPAHGPGGHKLLELGKITPLGTSDADKQVTGADFSPNGSNVVIRTYVNAYEFSVPSRIDNWINEKPRTIKLNTELQGEAICYSLDGLNLITTSEMTPCQVSTIQITQPQFRPRNRGGERREQ